jgi:hypothetical protein
VALLCDVSSSTCAQHLCDNSDSFVPVYLPTGMNTDVRMATLCILTFDFLVQSSQPCVRHLDMWRFLARVDQSRDSIERSDDHHTAGCMYG